MKVFIAFLLLCVTLFAEQNSTKELSFFDEKDGSLDLSEYMSQVYGFIPMPILITEPAVGYGGGVSIIFLHDTLLGNKSRSGRIIPPSMSGVILAATENGTRMTGGFHKGYWLEDTLRTTTYIGHPNVYINLYNNNKAVEMHMDGWFFYQDVKFRIKESNFFLGASYMANKSNVSLDFPNIEKDFINDVNIASLGMIAEYDSRDNQLSPNEGMLLLTKAVFYDESVGSDFNFESYKVKGLFYNRLTKKINLDFSVQGETINGDKTEIAPYLYPFVMMRGVPMMKYQGESVVVAETQLSYQFTPRWRGLVFGGIGQTYKNQSFNDDASSSEDIYAGGAGFRYLISRKFGLRIGVDVAKSKEDEAFYIQFGTAWNGF